MQTLEFHDLKLEDFLFFLHLGQSNQNTRLNLIQMQPIDNIRVARGK